MTVRRFIGPVLTILLTTLALAPVALAGPQDDAPPLALTPKLQAYLAIAEQHFGQAVTADQCPEGPTITLYEFGGRTLGQAELQGCRIWIAPRVYSGIAGVVDASTQQAADALLCNLVVHEYGHLLGLRHSPDPASVMHELLKTVVSACPAVPSNVQVAYGSVISVGLIPQAPAQPPVVLHVETHEQTPPAPATPKSARQATTAKSKTSAAKRKTCKRVKGRRVCRKTKSKAKSKARVRAQSRAKPKSSKRTRPRAHAPKTGGCCCSLCAGF